MFLALASESLSVKSAQIRAIAAYLPSNVLKNDELIARFSGWTAEKMEQKLGILSRPIADEKETATDMAISAAQRLFDKGVCSPEDIDFLIFCTQSPDYILPTSACVIQSRLGIPKKAGALDFNLGCSGYVYGLALAKGLVETGLAKKLLFLTSETYSKYINEDDRASRPLFGDGASATLVELVATPAADSSEKPEKPEKPEKFGPMLGPFEFGTDGSGADLLIVPAGGSRKPSSMETRKIKRDLRGNLRSEEDLYMSGPGIFYFAVDEVPPLVASLQKSCREEGLSLDAYIFHQANRYMLDRLRELCGLENARYYNNMLHRGNTVSSSVPIAILDAMAEDFIHRGDGLLLVGFGVGLSWGACRVVLPDDFIAIFP